MVEYELRIIKRTRADMFKATERDAINKIYRQARTWNRYHHFYAGACTYEKYRFLNKRFKQARLDALAAIR